MTTIQHAEHPELRPEWATDEQLFASATRAIEVERLAFVVNGYTDVPEPHFAWSCSITNPGTNDNPVIGWGSTPYRAVIDAAAQVWVGFDLRPTAQSYEDYLSDPPDAYGIPDGLTREQYEARR